MVLRKVLAMSVAIKQNPQNDRHYTYADYLTWDDDIRYEIIDGVPYAMAGANLAHQVISGELYSQLHGFLNGKPCMVLAAPFDVRLNAESHDDIVVQPDLLVVCNKFKLDDKSYKGAPDMVVEILSPSTAGRDKLVKFNKYLKAGVKEYWIVDPERKIVEVYVLRGTSYIASVYSENDVATVNVLKGCQIDLKDVFGGLST